MNASSRMDFWNELQSALGAITISSVAAAIASSLAVYIAYKLLTRVDIPSYQVPIAEECGDEKIYSDAPIQDSKRPGYIQCYDPSSSRRLGEVKAMKIEEVNNVVAKAAVAQHEWCKTSFSERRRVLECMKKYILSHQTEICEVAAKDSGKSKLDASLGEVLVTCEKIKCTCLYGESWIQPEKRPTCSLLPHKVAYVEYHPLGVLGVIAPWNYPFHNVFNHIISGIFCGNAVVTKVSEYTCWSSSYIISIAKNALVACGHNPDLCSVVTGFGDAGAALVRCPQIDKVIFTGSPEIGKKVMLAAAEYLKPVVLELGGKDPMIICDDADINTVLPFVMRGVYQNSGQNCIGAERIYAYEKIYDEFCLQAVNEVRKIRQGPPLGNAPCDCGAMVMPAQIEKIQILVDDAVSKGARVLCGGRKNVSQPNGYFYEPTVLADVTSDMDIAKSEVFGPVMSIFKVANNDDATVIKLVNESSFGLGSSVFSGNQGRAIRIGSALRCGMTSINDFGVYYLAQTLPFGGIKQSGFGKFAGPEGLKACCLQKSVVIDKVSMIRTTIPRLLQYPVAPGGFNFATAMINVIYDDTLRGKVGAVYEMIMALSSND